MVIDTWEAYQKKFYSIDKLDNRIHQGNIYKNQDAGHEDIAGLVIISNECDLMNKKNIYVHYSPIFKIDSKIKTNISDRNLDRLAKIMQQRKSGYFYLLPFLNDEKSKGYIIDCSQIKFQIEEDFKRAYSSPDFKIKTPYREKLSWKFANLFGRVPIDIPNESIIINWLRNNFTK